MIERKFVAQNIKEYQIQEYISENLKNVGHSHTKVQRTPLGEKIIIHASRPGLIVGRKGQNIKELTKALKRRFNLENPQIEISEVESPNTDAKIVAERIANSLEKFGISKFKAVGHKAMIDVLGSGALGIEILMSGKIPSSRAKRWRFYQGYLKKCGDLAVEGVKHAYATAYLKTGVVGIQVRIMPSNIVLPDRVTMLEHRVEVVEELPVEKKEEEPKKRTKPKGKKKENKEEKNKEEKQEEKKEDEASEEKIEGSE